MKKIMIVNTSTDVFEGTEIPTGLWLSELVHFYNQFRSDDYQVDLFNITGGNTPIDPVSLGRLTLDKTTKSYLYDENFMNLLKYSQPIAEADPKQYDAIYFTGGHGVMFDFPDNKDAQNAINEIYNHGGIVSAVCHGIAGLLNAKNSKGRFIIDQHQLTGFSNVEEVLANRKNVVPFKLEDEIKRRGTHYSKAKLPFRPYVVVDGQIVTGQNPQSPEHVAREVKALLNK
ncbi:type 1 glutamine amidotransferase domain-containing protein [Staphylococcus pasteuri]|uniref:type 1 glutamine amidotransferase domain-containing protein n=1 Tax=Staphylococcus pasteuri TaxID=45972 RepID=UPI001E3E90EF|nr:type 1 glutamine amidotransferase domain-containing protein [Staphylococcus pasteuri]MCE3022167.1 type 1 glutamine amidotransferase domain-containing protein [Staphylococcus pasteuri]